MLKHGLQELDGEGIVLPHRAEWRPRRELLEVRLGRFLGR